MNLHKTRLIQLLILIFLELINIKQVQKLNFYNCPFRMLFLKFECSFQDNFFSNELTLNTFSDEHGSVW